MTSKDSFRSSETNSECFLDWVTIQGTVAGVKQATEGGRREKKGSAPGSWHS